MIPHQSQIQIQFLKKNSSNHRETSYTIKLKRSENKNKISEEKENTSNDSKESFNDPSDEQGIVKGLNVLTKRKFNTCYVKHRSDK
jgi:hypothetical protein